MNNPIVFVNKVVLVPMIKFESKANDPVVPFLRASFSGDPAFFGTLYNFTYIYVMFSSQWHIHSDQINQMA